MAHDHPGHVYPDVPRPRPGQPDKPRAGSPSPWRLARPEPRTVVSHGRQVSLTVGDRRHWELDAGRLNVSRWCPGAPCSDEVASGPHWVRVRLWRRAWSARYSDPPQEWSKP